MRSRRRSPGPVAEGDVGGGTGMRCFGFKGGIGTASRKIEIAGKPYTVGVLVQCNTGDRKTLRIAGAPVGHELAARWLPCYDAKLSPADKLPKCVGESSAGKPPPDQGSIIIVVGTDAPLMPLQLNRVAKRAAMGLARLGSYSGNSSGDLIVSFSTASPPATIPKSHQGDAHHAHRQQHASIRCSRARWRRPKKPSSTRWSPLAP